MGLTKQYLRWEPAGNFNIIANQKCNSVFVNLNNVDGRYLAVGAAENVLIWDMRSVIILRSYTYICGM